jgi:hypothetical protein
VVKDGDQVVVIDPCLHCAPPLRMGDICTVHSVLHDAQFDEMIVRLEGYRTISGGHLYEFMATRFKLVEEGPW